MCACECVCPYFCVMLPLKGAPITIALDTVEVCSYWLVQSQALANYYQPCSHCNVLTYS